MDIIDRVMWWFDINIISNSNDKISIENFELFINQDSKVTDLDCVIFRFWHSF